MNRILLSIGLLCLLCSPIKLFAQEKETVMIRVHYAGKGCMGEQGMLVYDPRDNISYTPFSNKEGPGIGKENYREGDLIVKKEINKWLNQGFQISDLSSSAVNCHQIMIILLEKETT